MIMKRQSPVGAGLHQWSIVGGNGNSTTPLSHPDTWALPLVKARLLAGEHITQASMLEATQGQAWRLSAAIYYLSKHGWDIRRYDRGGIRVYHLDHAEIQRLRAESGRVA